ncbi:MAG: hypothetical protein Q4C64_05830 [Erysipelotrichia bacterium]|nr:hypothetical protein [Erysipelotrichia bacterium]
MKRLMNIFLIICLLISLTGCKSKEEKAEDYLQKNEYKKAYDILYDLDEYHTRADEVVVKWYKYCLDNDMLDKDLEEIKIVKYNDVYQTVLNYLSEKVNPDKQQCDMVLSILNKIDDKLSKIEDERYIYVKQSLEMKFNGQYIYDIPQWDSLSYEQYYSTVHNYTDDNLNDIGNSIKAYKDEIGIGVAKYANSGEIEIVQYILFGDFDKYEFMGNEYSHPSYLYTSTDRSSTLTISSKANFDGYWYYYFTQDESRNYNGLYRISINNETEEIISTNELNGKDILTAFVVDHDVLYTYIEDKDSKTVYRIYLPEMKKDTYTLDIPQGPLFALLVPQDNQHLKYQTYSQEFLKKYAELKNDKDGLYELLNKHVAMNKDEFYSGFDTMFDHITTDKYATSIVYALRMEYGDNYSDLYDYSYDFKTKEVTVTKGESLPLMNWK